MTSNGVFESLKNRLNILEKKLRNVVRNQLKDVHNMTCSNHYVKTKT